MKLIKYFLPVVVLALLLGCATTFRPWKLSEIKEGMDKTQVVEVLGEPDSTETKDGVESLYYTYSENYNPPLTTDSIHSRNAQRELRDRQIKQSLKKYNYVVKLVDGKVQTYKEIQE